MTSRREFLAAAGAVAIPVGRLSSTEPSRVAASAPGRIVVDDAFAESRIWGRQLEQRGLAVRTLSRGDVTALWTGDLASAWRAGPVTVAGLTGRSALFCLEQLAWAHRLRVVFHAEHALAGAGVTHTVHRDMRGTGLTAAALTHRGPLWTAHLAEVFAGLGSATCGREGPSCVALEPALPAQTRLLHSWIIAAA